MKLLLTSAGITNKPIGAALQELVGKPASTVKVGFIGTAANVETGNKDWYIAQINNLLRFGFSWIDFVDISGAGVDWKTRLAETDVMFLGGGNTYYLLDQVRKTGFNTWLKENIQNKIYIGVSAGSILMTPTIAVVGLEPADENLPGLTDMTGLGYVDFEIEPHCDVDRLVAVKDYADTTTNSVYAIDDETAIQIIDDEVKIISRGSWKLYEK